MTDKVMARLHIAVRIHEAAQRRKRQNPRKKRRKPRKKRCVVAGGGGRRRRSRRGGGAAGRRRERATRRRGGGGGGGGAAAGGAPSPSSFVLPPWWPVERLRTWPRRTTPSWPVLFFALQHLGLMAKLHSNFHLLYCKILYMPSLMPCGQVPRIKAEMRILTNNCSARGGRQLCVQYKHTCTRSANTHNYSTKKRYSNFHLPVYDYCTCPLMS